MKRFITITFIILIPISILLFYVFSESNKLNSTVESDFYKKHPTYKLIDCIVGEGDMAVAYMHISYKKPNDTVTYNEVWQYWSKADGWENREAHFNNEGFESISDSHIISDVKDSIKYEMFCESMQNLSTAPNYVVINVKNINTGITEEVCVEATSLISYVSAQYDVLSQDFDCEKFKDRYFDFSLESDIWKQNYEPYSISELNEYSKRINLEDIIQKVKDGVMTDKIFQNNKREQIMFAHLMFNHGIMVTRGCIAGNICDLSYFVK